MTIGTRPGLPRESQPDGHKQGSSAARSTSDVPSMGPIPKRATLAEQAYDHIKAAIIAGEVEPGQLYSVSQFSTLLEVSRTPVREALLTLAADGFLTVHRNRGFQVAPVTIADIHEIVDVRRLLEVPAMERLAVMDPQPTEALSTAEELYPDLQKAADSGRVRDFLALDRRFHLTLTDAVGNHRLTTIVADLRDRMHLPGLRKLAESGSLHESGRDHLHLLEAIKACDPDQAARIMRLHLDRTVAEWS